MSPLFRITFLLEVAHGLRMRGQSAGTFQEIGGVPLNQAYTFEEFVHDFGRSYRAGSEEYARRVAIFHDSLAQIRAKNFRAGRSWTAGVHPFMDWTDAERSHRLHGYAPSDIDHPQALAVLQTDGHAAFDEQVYGGAGDSFEAEAPAVQNQDLFGHCGSCWAFAAVAAVEARLMKMDSPLIKGQPQLSVQTLLDCVPKKKDCRGGCQGATPELAFDFMRDKGVPLEANVPYSPFDSPTKCPIEPFPTDWVRVTLSSWRALPRNQAQPLMQALVKDGPVAVTADAHTWYDYYSGIYDECPRDAVPNHSVLARGYGIQDGKKYWLLQNSWGTQWGEEGAIRIIRRDDEDQWCGIDNRTQEGVECDNAVTRNVTVCGSCGLLYDMFIPEVGYVMLGPGDFSNSSSPGTAPAEQQAAAGQIVDSPFAAFEVAPSQPSTTQSATAIEQQDDDVNDASTSSSASESSANGDAPHQQLAKHVSASSAVNALAWASDSIMPVASFMFHAEYGSPQPEALPLEASKAAPASMEEAPHGDAMDVYLRTADAHSFEQESVAPHGDAMDAYLRR